MRKKCKQKIDEDGGMQSKNLCFVFVKALYGPDRFGLMCWFQIYICLGKISYKRQSWNRGEIQFQWTALLKGIDGVVVLDLMR